MTELIYGIIIGVLGTLVGVLLMPHLKLMRLEKQLKHQEKEIEKNFEESEILKEHQEKENLVKEAEELIGS